MYWYRRVKNRRIFICNYESIIFNKKSIKKQAYGIRHDIFAESLIKQTSLIKFQDFQWFFFKFKLLQLYLMILPNILYTVCFNVFLFLALHIQLYSCSNL